MTGATALGGAVGHRAERAGVWFNPQPWVLLAGTISYLVLMLRQLPCQLGAPVYKAMCYSDILPLFYARGLAEGKVPFISADVEYPVLTGAFMEVTRRITMLLGGQVGPDVSDAQTAQAAAIFVGVNALLLFVFFLVVLWAHLRLARPWDAMMIAVAPAVMTTGFINWDFMVLAFTALGVLAWARKRPGWAGVWWGLGVAAKLYPLLLFVPLAVLCFRSGRLRAFWLAVAGGVDKVPAILATLRGGLVNVLVTDAVTGRGILTAEGYQGSPRRPTAEIARPLAVRSQVKKLINAPQEVVDESLAGALAAHADLIAQVPGTPRAVRALAGPRAGKVGIVIGGGAGHEPGFWGYVGRGLADAAAVGNVFAAPPPDPILAATRAADGGAGILYLYGNFSGDVMNFDMAAELATAEGTAVRSVVTTDDIASSPIESRAARRGVAGNVFIFKIAGAAADRMLRLEACEALARRANARTFTMGLALEPCAPPETRRPSFELGPNDMEIGVGVHGEPGVARERMASADAAADLLLDRLLAELRPKEGDRVAVLVNSLGGTPAMELYIVYRRVRQRLAARGVSAVRSLVGPYYTSLDMAGVSISLLHLDDELLTLLDHPCRAPALSLGAPA